MNSFSQLIRNYRRGRAVLILSTIFVVALVMGIVDTYASPPPQADTPAPASQNPSGQTLSGQTKDQADAKSKGCISCHVRTDSASMHPTDTVQLGCTDCHGGNSDAKIAASSSDGDAPGDVMKA